VPMTTEKVHSKRTCILGRIFRRRKKLPKEESPIAKEPLAVISAPILALGEIPALDPGSPLFPLDVQLRTGSHAARIAAAEKLAEAGEPGARVLMLALKESDVETYETAAWGIEIPLIEQGRGGLSKEKLRELLRPATRYLTDIVWGATILKGANAYDRRVSHAIGVLGSIGDRAALPALELLLIKVRRKIEVEGIVREHVETREKLGWVSTEDDLHHLERQIENINTGL
jgi:hypothetical protein